MPAALRSSGIVKLAAPCEPGLQPLLAGPQHQKLLRQHVVFGARLGVVEHDQYVAGIDPITFLHVELLDEPAGFPGLVGLVDGLAAMCEPARK